MDIRKYAKQSFIYEIYKKIRATIFLNLIFKKDFYKMLGSYKNILSKFLEEQPVELKLNKNDKCLLLAPHPDDECIGCAGLLLSFPEQFDVICLTDGRYGGIDLSHDQQLKLIETRKSEFQAAMEMSKVNSYNYLEIQDKNLANSYDIFKSLDISHYDYIFIPNFMDINTDHKSVTIHLKKLLKEKPHNNSLKIAFYEVWSTLALPNYYFDISTNIKNKVNLINLYESQLKLMNYTDIISLNKYRGFVVSKPYVEAYTIIDTSTFLIL